MVVRWFFVQKLACLQLSQQLLPALRPVFRELLETPHDQVCNTRWNTGGYLSNRDRLGANVSCDHFVRRHPVKRRLAGEQLIGKATERIDVSAMVSTGIPYGL